MKELVESVLVIVVGAGIRGLIGVVNKGLDYVNKYFGTNMKIWIDDQTYNALVLGIVVFLLAQLGLSEAVRAGLI